MATARPEFQATGQLGSCTPGTQAAIADPEFEPSGRKARIPSVPRPTADPEFQAIAEFQAIGRKARRVGQQSNARSARPGIQTQGSRSRNPSHGLQSKESKPKNPSA